MLLFIILLNFFSYWPRNLGETGKSATGKSKDSLASVKARFSLPHRRKQQDLVYNTGKNELPQQQESSPAFFTARQHNGPRKVQQPGQLFVRRSRISWQVFQLRRCCHTARIAAVVFNQFPSEQYARGSESSPAKHFAFAQCINKS